MVSLLQWAVGLFKRKGVTSGITFSSSPDLQNAPFLWLGQPNLPKNEEIVLSSIDVQGILLANPTNTQNPYLCITDDFYNTWDENTYEALMSLDYFRYKQYIAEKQDCDKFAIGMTGEAKWVLQGTLYNNSFGFVQVNIDGGGAHELNFFITSNKQLWYAEPQNGQCFPFSTMPNYHPRMYYI